jgi:DNA processing protein
LIALHLTPGIGAVSIAQLMHVCGSAAAVWSAPADTLADVPEVGARAAAMIPQARRRVDVGEELRRADACGARIVTWLDPDYPEALRPLRDAPPVLYIRGAWREGPEPVVAVVGTRRASAYGLGIAGALGEILAGAGATVVSGLARGIDGAAHTGVLRAGGVTVGVLGCGVDVVYPPEHRRLMETMQQRGALVSEVPIGTQPRRQQFPRRNRLISGLAGAVVVVEGDVDSGALITARCALAQGRHVFAVPGSIHAFGSRGPHQLLAQGARVLGTPSDLFAALGLVHVAGRSRQDGARTGPPRKEAHAVQPSIEPEPDALVLAVMGEEALHIDAVISRTGLRPADVTAALATLEMRGLVRQFPGKHFARSRLPDEAGWFAVDAMRAHPRRE